MEGDKGGGDGSCLFVGVSTGEVDGEGLAGESSTIALSLSAPVNASKALIQKFGGGGLGGASFFGSFPMRSRIQQTLNLRVHILHTNILWRE